jgi:integrase/recombinase XerC
LADARKPTTKRAREIDVLDFARFLAGDGPPVTPGQACAAFVANGRGAAAALVTAYVSDQLDRRGLAHATINRRTSTLRRLATLAYELEVIEWSLVAKTLPEQPYRDTRGPGRAGWLRVLDVATRAAAKTDTGRRDLVIIRLLHDHGLRRAEVAGLDLVDWDGDQGRLMVLGKGKGDKAPITINQPTILAMAAYLSARGDAPGPLFVRLDRARDKSRLQRIDGDSLRKITRRLGKRAGLSKPVRPHGLRHEGITRALDLTGGDVRKAQRFARHSKVETTVRYDDNRSDFAGEVARLLGDDA